jgi:hypothetical protein
MAECTSDPSFRTEDEGQQTKDALLRPPSFVFRRRPLEKIVIFGTITMVDRERVRMSQYDN